MIKATVIFFKASDPEQGIFFLAFTSFSHLRQRNNSSVSFALTVQLNSPENEAGTSNGTSQYPLCLSHISRLHFMAFITFLEPDIGILFSSVYTNNLVARCQIR
jgi:hypothetical protein